MVDVVENLRDQIQRAVQGQDVIVSVPNTEKDALFEVKAYYYASDTHDFECTWTFLGVRWHGPEVLSSLKDGKFGGIGHVNVPPDAQEFFSEIGKKICSCGLMTPSELALLDVLMDPNFEICDISKGHLRNAVIMLQQEMAFKTKSLNVDTLHAIQIPDVCCSNDMENTQRH